MAVLALLLALVGLPLLPSGVPVLVAALAAPLALAVTRAGDKGTHDEEAAR